MHVYFSGIGGTGIGPIAQIAHQSNMKVSGSDKRSSNYIKYLISQGIHDIYLDQNLATIQKVHSKNPIDWFVYSSAIQFENNQSEEIKFCQDNHIKISKRDEFVNYLISLHHLKMIAIAGTHGKTTLTAMMVYLFKKLNIPSTYVLPAKTDFASMGEFDQKSHFFIYEADEFDRNFLSFQPYLSIISGIGYDHHEIYPTLQDYIDAFKKFINQSQYTIMWQKEADQLNKNQSEKISIFNDKNDQIKKIKLIGKYNRQDAYLAVQAMKQLFNHLDTDNLIKTINTFPGLSRRMEKITTNLYTDYAHTPEKITAAINVAQETCQKLIKDNLSSGKIIIIYEPLTNRRQYYIKDQYYDLFDQVDQIYWVPSYLAREDPNQTVLQPEDLIKYLKNPQKAMAQKLDNHLKQIIDNHLKNKDLVLALSGGGGESLDEWLRNNFHNKG